MIVSFTNFVLFFFVCVLFWFDCALRTVFVFRIVWAVFVLFERLVVAPRSEEAVAPAVLSTQRARIVYECVHSLVAALLDCYG